MSLNNPNLRNRRNRKQDNFILPAAIPFGDVTLGELKDFRDFKNDIARSKSIPAQAREDFVDDEGESEEDSIYGDILENPKKKKKKKGKYTQIVPDLYNVHFAGIASQAFDYARLYNIADNAGTVRHLNEILRLCDNMLAIARPNYGALDDERAQARYEAGNYFRAVEQLKGWIHNPLGNMPPIEIFAQDNAKLPFWCFSALPATTCPMAGACLTKNSALPHTAPHNRGWCYSFGCWSKVFPFFRQFQNTILVRLKAKNHIMADMRMKLQEGDPVRLYVDGDMDSEETIDMWMDIVRRFPKNPFYGYSKSWEYFYDWHRNNNGNWPENYLLNLSSGTVYEREGTADEWMARMQSLKNPRTGKPLVRGRFVAVNVKNARPSEDKIAPRGMSAEEREEEGLITQQKFDGLKDKYEAEVRLKAADIEGSHKGILVCPNYCGSCLHGKHACGNRSVQNVLVAIGVH